MPKKTKSFEKKRYKNFVGIQKVITFASAFASKSDFSLASIEIFEKFTIDREEVVQESDSRYYI